VSPIADVTIDGDDANDTQLPVTQAFVFDLAVAGLYGHVLRLGGQSHHCGQIFGLRSESGVNRILYSVVPLETLVF
jgi:hypothetical protein